MALTDTISFGFALPHRATDPIDVAAVRQVAQRADALGFRDLWVTENTLDHVFCLDSVVALTYAAAVTTKIRLGVSVMVLRCTILSMWRTRSPRSTISAMAARFSAPVWVGTATTRSFRFRASGACGDFGSASS